MLIGRLASRLHVAPRSGDIRERWPSRQCDALATVFGPVRLARALTVIAVLLGGASLAVYLRDYRVRGEVARGGFFPPYLGLVHPWWAWPSAVGASALAVGVAFLLMRAARSRLTRAHG